MPEYFHEPARQTPVIVEAEVVILGGGPAGIAAAAAAARNGAKTLLVERYGFLGGAASMAMVSNFCGIYTQVDGEILQVVHGLVDEILERIERYDGLNSIHSVFNRSGARSFDIAAYKLAADDLLLDAGVTLLFHCQAVGAILEGGEIQALLVESKSGRGAIRGRYFIDCSGDGDLAHFAHAPYAMGDAAGFLQYPTMMFRMANVDSATALRAGRPNLQQLAQEATVSGEWRLPRADGITNPQPHQGEWRVNMTQVQKIGGAPLDGTDVFDLTYGEQQGRQQAWHIAQFLKQMVPGFENSYLLAIAPQIGIRETRRILGEYVLTEEDVLTGRSFSNSVGVNCWPIERHSKGKVDWKWIAGRGYHDIPFSCLVPLGVRNLLVAGRCASFSATAQAALRVSGPCFVMGQAAGTAAAHNVAANLSGKETDIQALQTRLRKDGVFLGK
jgi:hypothetical protein